MSPVSYLQGQGSLLTAAVLVPFSPPSGLHGLFKEQAVFFFRTRDGVGLVPRSTVSGGGLPEGEGCWQMRGAARAVCRKNPDLKFIQRASQSQLFH